MERVLTDDGQRARLFGVAYRIVGSASEAEDIVQDAFLRMHRAQQAGTVVDTPAAYLRTVTTRLSIDRLRSARHRRERYVGPWLPEPLVTDETGGVGHDLEMAESLSLAFLVLLEALGPVERAVFVLRDVFGCGYDEIAGIVGRSEVHCRQLAVRARRHLEGRRPRFTASDERRREVAGAFFEACRTGDVEALGRLLALDVAARSDGGGKARAIRRPISGRDRVARFLLYLVRRGILAGPGVRPAEVNGQPGARLVDPEGRVRGVVAIGVGDDGIRLVEFVVNPDKLGHVRAGGAPGVSPSASGGSAR